MVFSCCSPSLKCILVSFCSVPDDIYSHRKHTSAEHPLGGSEREQCVSVCSKVTLLVFGGFNTSTCLSSWKEPFVQIELNVDVLIFCFHLCASAVLCGFLYNFNYQGVLLQGLLNRIKEVSQPDFKAPRTWAQILLRKYKTVTHKCSNWKTSSDCNK